jgi:hypothetical protein
MEQDVVDELYALFAWRLRALSGIEAANILWRF